MSNIYEVVPKTLGGIKGLARKIKKTQNVSMSIARLMASNFAGYHNYAHARNAIGTNTPQKSNQYDVYITAYWVDEKTFYSGRETLIVTINQPLREMISPHQKSLSRGMHKFQFVGSDHLVTRFPAINQKRARDQASYASRYLQFINATSLKPSHGFEVYPEENSLNKLPSSDHTSVWRDEQGRLLFMDEPYGVEIENPKRLAWAKKFNQSIALSPWPSMYYPGASDMFLVSNNETGVPLDPIIKILSKLPLPAIGEDWKGESAPYSPMFKSPGQIEAASKPKIAVPKTEPVKPRGKRNTLAYGSIYVGYTHMPDGKMAIEDHIEIGQIILRILSNSYHRAGVTNRLELVRSELETWGFRDYRDTTKHDFIAIYYENIEQAYPRKLDQKTADSYLKDLNTVKSKLVKSYPECKPLSKVLNNLDYAIQSLQRWNS